jgi:uncharacterized membrane protein
VFFYLSIAAMCLGIAGGFAWLGFWPVLPFAGLELAALGTAFWVTQRRAGVRELVQVEEDRVTFLREGLGQSVEREFRRPWVRLELQRAPVGHWPSRLLLAAHGRSVEVGAFLTEDERVALKTRLGGVLAGETASPPAERAQA